MWLENVWGIVQHLTEIMIMTATLLHDFCIIQSVINIYRCQTLLFLQIITLQKSICKTNYNIIYLIISKKTSYILSGISCRNKIESPEEFQILQDAYKNGQFPCKTVQRCTWHYWCIFKGKGNLFFQFSTSVNQNIH